MTKPKFAIRDLLWLMMVLGLSLGWYLDHRRSESKLREVHLQWLMSIPGPEPKPELRIQLLEEQNERLEAELAQFKAQR